MMGAAFTVSPATIAEQAGLNLNPLALLDTGMGTGSLVPRDDSGLSSPPGASVGGKKSAGHYQKRKLFKVNLLETLQPDWWMDQRREQAKQVHAFDLDIAALHSVSIAGKVAIQRNRQFKRQLTDEVVETKRDLKERLWLATIGHDKNEDYWDD